MAPRASLCGAYRSDEHVRCLGRASSSSPLRMGGAAGPRSTSADWSFWLAETVSSRERASGFDGAPSGADHSDVTEAPGDKSGVVPAGRGGSRTWVGRSRSWGSAASAPAAGALTYTCTPSWAVSPSPEVRDGRLGSISATSSSDVWAVGEAGRGTAATRPPVSRRPCSSTTTAASGRPYPRAVATDRCMVSRPSPPTMPGRSATQGSRSPPARC